MLMLVSALARIYELESVYLALLKLLNVRFVDEQRRKRTELSLSNLVSKYGTWSNT